MDEGSSRSENLAKKNKVSDKLIERYDSIFKGYQDQESRDADANDYWDCYYCILNSNQSYHEDTDIYVPAISDAIEARVTRFTNQIFPTSGKHIEAISSDLGQSRARAALAEHYIRKADLRLLVPALLVNGHTEGHYWIYVAWNKTKRYVARRIKKSVSTQIGPVGDVPDIELEEEITDSYPSVDILSDADVLVLPSTSASLKDAIDQGGLISILRRWTEPKIRSLLEEGLIDKTLGEKLIKDMTKTPSSSSSRTDPAKQHVKAAGIHGEGRGKHVLVYEVWTNIETPEGDRLCQVFYGGPEKILHAHRNPLWCDRLPIIGHPARNVHGSYKGRPLVAKVAQLQYYINDLAMELADSSKRGMIPIVMSDPVENPRWKDMVYGQGALWPVNPNSTKILEFPPLYQHAMTIIQQVTSEIMRTLGVNPSMLTQMPMTQSKPSQARVAQEQAVDLLTTAVEVTALEEGIFTPYIELVMEMDHQYRDEKLQVRSYGELGMMAMMEEIQPIQMDNRVYFKWFGVEQARSAAMIQQQIAALNIIRGIPPQLYPNHTLNVAPAIVDLLDSAFGSQKGRLIFEDIRSQLSNSPDMENQMMDQGLPVHVHPMDPHQEHMQSHIKSLMETGDPTGQKREHLIGHQTLLAQKAAAQMQSMQPQGGQGQGGPRMGAQPGQQRPAQQPAGAMHHDRLQQQDPSVMPRARGNGMM